jgi:hypothetical protein
LVLSSEEFAAHYALWSADTNEVTGESRIGTLSQFVAEELRDSYVSNRKLDLQQSQVSCFKIQSTWDCDAIVILCETSQASTALNLPIKMDDKGTLFAIYKEKKTKIVLTLEGGEAEEVEIGKLETFKIGDLQSYYGEFEVFLVFPIKKKGSNGGLTGKRSSLLNDVREARLRSINHAATVATSLNEKSQLLSLPHHANTAKEAEAGKWSFLGKDAARCFWDAFSSEITEKAYIFVRLINCKESFASDEANTLQKKLSKFLSYSFDHDATILLNVDICRTFYGIGKNGQLSVCPSKKFAEKFPSSRKFPLFLTNEMTNFQGPSVKRLPQALFVNVYNNYKRKLMPFNKNIFKHSPIKPMFILNQILFGENAEYLMKSSEVADFKGEVKKAENLLSELKGMSTGIRFELRCSCDDLKIVLEYMEGMTLKRNDFFVLQSDELFEYASLYLSRLNTLENTGQMRSLVEESVKSDIVVNGLFHGRLYGGICRSELIKWRELELILTNFNHINLPVFLRETVSNSPPEGLTLTFFKSLSRFWGSSLASKIGEDSEFFSRLYNMKFRVMEEHNAENVVKQYSEDLKLNIFSNELPIQITSTKFKWTGTEAAANIFDVKKLDYSFATRGQFITPSMLLFLCFIQSGDAENKLKCVAKIIDRSVFFVHNVGKTNFFAKSNKYVNILKIDITPLPSQVKAEPGYNEENRESTKSTKEEIESAPKLDFKFAIKTDKKQKWL